MATHTSRIGTAYDSRQTLIALELQRTAHERPLAAKQEKRISYTKEKFFHLQAVMASTDPMNYIVIIGTRILYTLLNYLNNHINVYILSY